MIAKDLMTTNLTVISPDATVLEAAETMLRSGVGGLPVLDSKGNLVGVITKGDLIRRAEIATDLRRSGFARVRAGQERMAADYIKAHGKRVDQVMTKVLYTVSETTPLQTVADILDHRRINRVLVIDGQRLAGVISRTDLLRLLVDERKLPSSRAHADDEIRQTLISLYAGESWAPLASIDIFVSSGIVELVGTVQNETQRTALIIAAESVPGVKSVTDRLVRAGP